MRPEIAALRGRRTSALNAGDSAVEFEAFELHRERVVQPGQTITVNIPRLAPGTYQFVDDFSHGATSGEIVAR